jgi:FKBP-type peptidyl-prolyl cis-trans isomerase SlyD
MAPRVIGFHYTLTDTAGKELDSSQGAEPLYFMEGVGQIIPGLEAELKVLKVGDKRKIAVPAERAYGLRNQEHVLKVPRDKLPQGDIKVGDMFQTQDGHSPPLTVTVVTATHITLDANHPLAGIDLTFDIEIMEIRDATREEEAHGHAHGPGGHHH